jgi:dolichyl-diphosphooligosaccharide--protein glycosyltransferase
MPLNYPYAHKHVCALLSYRSHMFAKHVSNPSLVFKAQLRNGEVVLVDDYLQSYYWLNENTPDDARVLSW